jgi:PIN domain nuclease of toxin-antitoxin system
MLISRKRLQVDTDYQTFIALILSANHYTIKPITPEIADCSTKCLPESHKDPADRLIAATAICEDVPLITADKQLRWMKRI